MARYKYRVIVEPKNKKDLDVMFDSLDNILNDSSEYEGKFEYDYLNDKSFYVDFALSMDANVFADRYDPRSVNVSFSINEENITEKIEIKEEIRIPGTDVLLEKGDKINFVSKKTEDIIKDDEVIFEDSNFIFKKHYFIDPRKEEHFDYRAVTKRGSVADDYVVEIYVERHWDNPEIPKSVFVKYGLPGSMLNKSISTFISVLQNAVKFADKVAAYLKIKVRNK